MKKLMCMLGGTSQRKDSWLRDAVKSIQKANRWVWLVWVTATMLCQAIFTAERRSEPKASWLEGSIHQGMSCGKQVSIRVSSCESVRSCCWERMSAIAFASPLMWESLW